MQRGMEAGDMSEIELIQETLAKAARLRRMQRGLRGMWIGLFIGACAWLLVLGVYKLLPIPSSSLIWTGSRSSAHRPNCWHR